MKRFLIVFIAIIAFALIVSCDSNVNKQEDDMDGASAYTIETDYAYGYRIDNYIDPVSGNKVKSIQYNAITGKNACQISSRSDICTRYICSVTTEFKNERFQYIDTPALDDIREQDNILNKIKKAASECRNLKYLLILLNFQQSRITYGLMNDLKII